MPKSAQTLKNSELICESEKWKRNVLDDVIEKKLGSSMSYPYKPIPQRYISCEYNSEEDPPSFPDD